MNKLQGYAQRRTVKIELDDKKAPAHTLASRDASAEMRGHFLLYEIDRRVIGQAGMPGRQIACRLDNSMIFADYSILGAESGDWSEHPC